MRDDEYISLIAQIEQAPLEMTLAEIFAKMVSDKEKDIESALEKNKCKDVKEGDTEFASCK